MPVLREGMVKHAARALVRLVLHPQELLQSSIFVDSIHSTGVAITATPCPRDAVLRCLVVLIFYRGLCPKNLRQANVQDSQHVLNCHMSNVRASMAAEHELEVHLLDGSHVLSSAEMCVIHL